MPRGLRVKVPHLIEWSRRLNLTKVLRSSQVIMTVLLVLCVPMLLALLLWDLVANPNPVPAVITIAGLVLLCFFFSYVFVVPDDLTSSATDRTLSISSKIFAHTRQGLTPEATLGACRIILPETLASAICITDGKQVLASWGEGSEQCPAGTSVAFETTARVMASGATSVFTRDGDAQPGDLFPRLRAGVVAPLKVRDRCMGTLGLFYPRASSIDMRQTALATGFAELISTQLASFELERQDELTARIELRALQSQVDPHFLFNTIGTIASLVRTDPELARSLLIDFSNYYRQTLSNSEELVTLASEIDQGMRYINLMQARFGSDRLCAVTDIDPDVLDCRVPPFILQPLLENCIKHAMRETGMLSMYVRARRSEGRLTVVVEDDGVGMDEATLAHLFEARDAALEGNDDIAADGSTPRGCGLALVNVLMRIKFFFGEESGIHIESELGKGTRATVSLVGEPRDLAQSPVHVRA
ncbi:sensor histidine kinase [Collinsella sp. An2]|nr:sensor histidine kinase [Collinsella sp. An2]